MAYLSGDPGLGEEGGGGDDGEDNNKDPSRAARWFRQAAKHNHAEAHYQVLCCVGCTTRGIVAVAVVVVGRVVPASPHHCSNTAYAVANQSLPVYFLFESLS